MQRGGIFNIRLTTNVGPTEEYSSEKKLLGSDLTELWPRVCCGRTFLDRPVLSQTISSIAANSGRPPPPSKWRTRERLGWWRHLIVTTPFSGNIFIGRLGLAMINLYTKFQVPACSRYEDMNGGAKCTNSGSLGQLGGVTPTRSTQPCIPPGSLNRVPASAWVRAKMSSPLPGSR